MVTRTQIMVVKTKGNYQALKDFLGPYLAVTELDEKCPLETVWICEQVGVLKLKP